MVRELILSASLAVALGLTVSTALADGAKETADRHRIVNLDRGQGLSRKDARVNNYQRAGFRHRYGYQRHPHRYRVYADRPWDGVYGAYPRRHFFLSGVRAGGFYSPVNVATVSYRTYVYYTPTYPSVSYGYPPSAYLYDLTHGPVYNKPCFC